MAQLGTCPSSDPDNGPTGRRAVQPSGPDAAMRAWPRARARAATDPDGFFCFWADGVVDGSELDQTSTK